jgi:hypothetical protein
VAEADEVDVDTEELVETQHPVLETEVELVVVTWDVVEPMPERA